MIRLLVNLSAKAVRGQGMYLMIRTTMAPVMNGSVLPIIPKTKAIIFKVLFTLAILSIFTYIILFSSSDNHRDKQNEFYYPHFKNKELWFTAFK